MMDKTCWRLHLLGLDSCSLSVSLSVGPAMSFETPDMFSSFIQLDDSHRESDDGGGLTPLFDFDMDMDFSLGLDELLVEEQAVQPDLSYSSCASTTSSSIFSDLDQFLLAHTQPTRLIGPKLLVAAAAAADDDDDALPAPSHLKKRHKQTKGQVDHEFLKCINDKLSRYTAYLQVQNNYLLNQDYFDKVRFQEISYRFSKTYF